MGDPPLLQVRTADFHLEVRGPFSNPKGPTGQANEPHPQAVLHVESAPAAQVHCRLPDGTFGIWLDGQPGPSFFEQSVYRFNVRALGGSEPPFCLHRDPLFFDNVLPIEGTSIRAGTITFDRQIGRSRFEVFSGEAKLSVTVEVFPSKLDYATDFRELLRDLDSTARGLALDFLTATFHLGGQTNDREPRDIEWAHQLRNVTETIERGVRYINEHPIHSLSREEMLLRSEQVRRPTPSLVTSIARGRGAGDSLQVGSVSVRQFVRAFQAREVVDTPEHRWIASCLRAVRSRALDLAEEVGSELQNEKLAARRSAARVRAAVAELTSVAEVVEQLLTLPVFAGVGDAREWSFSSLTLQTAPGYQEVARAMVALRSAIGMGAGETEFSTKQVSELYELWCYIRLVGLVLECSGATVAANEVVKVDTSGFRIRLRRGERSTVRVEVGTLTLELTYNETFPGITGDQRPDILLRFRTQGMPDVVVLFDAKYRLDASPEYVATFAQAGPPVEAINALHRYRDAIVLGESEAPIGRPVVKGVALFPLNSDEEAFTSHKLYRGLAVLGVGAIPFMPGQVDLARAWLSKLLSLSPTELANPGPPFLAYEALREEHQT